MPPLSMFWMRTGSPVFSSIAYTPIVFSPPSQTGLPSAIVVPLARLLM